MRLAGILAAAALAPLVPRPASAEQSLSSRFKGDNLVVISMTGASASHMSVYGYPRATTPGLGKWAKDALVFEDDFAHASWTLPSNVSLLTSLYPYSHGVWTRQFKNKLPARVLTLPETLLAAGYRTALFSAGLDYHPHFSQFRGFQMKPLNPNFSPISVPLEEAKKWLETTSGNPKPFFLMIQGYDTHCPFQAAAPFRGTYADPKLKSAALDDSQCVRGIRDSSGTYTAYYTGECARYFAVSPCTPTGARTVTLTADDMRYIEGAYDETMAQADAAVSGFLASLPPALAARTVVVVTADHGEMFSRHGRFGRAGTLRGTHYDDVLHIPLMIRLPGVAGRRVKGLAQTIDLMPTVLDLLGVAVSTAAQGVSLVPLADTGRPVNDAVYSGVPYNLRTVSREVLAMFSSISLAESVRDERWKLLHERIAKREDGRGGPDDREGETWELYDVAKDPEESVDLAASRPDVVAALRARLEKWRAKTFAESVQGGNGTTPIPESLIRSAREHGYWE